MAPEPVFFELSWSILSTIGIANVLFGFLVVSVTDFTLISSVPIVASAACALANGLCYYAYYLTSRPVVYRVVASVFADIAWLVQEAGLSMYGYLILRRILVHRPWNIFATSFWVILLAVTMVRIVIAFARARIILRGNDLQQTVNYLHMAYFPLIALLEIVSAYFLLTTFAGAKFSGFKRTAKTGLINYLMRSTEVRMAFLAIIGIMRAVTYSFQVDVQSATHVPSQVDRFCYTMECLFPMVMYIDILSSKVVYSNQHRDFYMGDRLAASQPAKRGMKAPDDPTSHNSRTKHTVEIRSTASDPGGVSRTANKKAKTSSQEHIVSSVSERLGTATSDVEIRPMSPCRTR